MNDHDEIMHILKRLESVEKKIEALSDGICAKRMSRAEVLNVE
jgi:tetrahydromethanopterin S-methyltransferase subunit G